MLFFQYILVLNIGSSSGTLPHRLDQCNHGQHNIFRDSHTARLSTLHEPIFNTSMFYLMVELKGVEPLSLDCKSKIIPLYYSPITTYTNNRERIPLRVVLLNKLPSLNIIFISSRSVKELYCSIFILSRT